MLSPFKRLILAGYCLTIAAACTWVPWYGYQSPQKDKLDPYFLGYGFVWSAPNPPESFVLYSHSGEQIHLSPSNEFVDPNGKPTSPMPRPEGYIHPAAYQMAKINFGQVLLESVALTAIGFAAWIFIPTRASESAEHSSLPRARETSPGTTLEAESPTQMRVRLRRLSPIERVARYVELLNKSIGK